MLSRITRFILGNKVDRVPSAPDALSNDDEQDIGLIVTRDIDGLTEHERQAFWVEASKAADIPLFEGSVEHGYAAALVADPDLCPRCGGRTEMKYANFIYSTQLAMRVMFAPAGCFCTKCPTVIVEEELIEAGVTDRRFHYERVIGVDYGGKKDADYFRTWNGEDLVYILDEDGHLEGITTRGRFEHHASPVAATTVKKNASKKNRDKLARRSRKRNRKR